MEKNKQKPKSYDFFTGNNNSEKKNIWRKIWKWFKVLIYIFIFGVTLTGCIQSFAIKTSSHAGSGVEFYNSKEGIAPNAVVFEKQTNKEGKEVLNIKKNNDNFYVSNQDKERKDVIEALKKQAKGSYGQWGNYNTLIVYQSDKPVEGQSSYQYPKGDNGELLYFNSTTENYNQKFNDWKEIKLLREFKDNIKLTHNAKYVNEKDPFIYSYFETVKDYIVPNEDFIENNNKFARDVIHYLNNQLVNFDKYNNNKLENAIKEIEEKGTGASEQSISLVNDYSANLREILKATHYTKIGDGIVAFEPGTAKNASDLLSYKGAEPQKIIVTWGDAWQLGPFYGLFIWPMSKLMAALLDSMSLEGLQGWPAIITIIIAVILTKLLSFAFRFKTLFSQSKQQEVQAKKAKIDAKYAPHKGNKQMEARQRQEIAELYKKNNISPAAQFQALLITMPIFVAMWRILQGLPGIKATTWLGINLASTSYQELFAGQWIYLPILLFTVIIQLFQQILPRILNRKQNKRLINAAESQALKKQQKTQNYTMILFVVFGVIFQASLQVYWIVGGVWEIGQILFVHYFQRTKVFKEKVRPWINKPKKI
ncbi:membrane protein insertase YidC [Mycoplasma sp. 480]|uniref:membrane protein insertase YidC n=1 Tax=Mycoplasma sp. 480 TaxID=3440155 RepID=UPI003F517F3D